MKQKKLDNIYEKRENQNEEIKKKSEHVEKKIQENKEKKIIDLKEMQEKNKNAVEILQGKVENILHENEVQRQMVQEQILEKLNRFSDNNKRNIEKKHVDFENKLAHSFQNFESKYRIMNEKVENKLKMDKEKPLERYEKWYINCYEKGQEKKEKKKIKQLDKEDRKLEKLDQIVSERKVSEQAIIDNLKKSETKRNELKKEFNEKWKNKGDEMHQRYLKLLEKKKQQDENRNLKGIEILERHTVSLTKANNIEELFGETKSTIYDKTIISQIDTEKRLNMFMKKLDLVKNSSLLKKSPGERKQYYIDLKRKEEEERKKKEEAEQKKQE